ncbi:organic cation transporter protein-like isoform X2 [Vanessa cardui]|uniref:organic cation transporter protein-like isoform X2 n=1 Tax=Vanessa cardui TaxID=171605 RepID=UPI001F13D231|nr:organic cation transporter protein-like isoform X2 [Vanessa cardui]
MRYAKQTENDHEIAEGIEDSEDDIGSALEIVIKHVGEIGLYQRLLFVIMMPFGLVWSFAYFGQMFITATPQEHWCRVPELDGLSLELRRSLSVPKISDTEYDQCFMFDANWTQVLETMLAPDPNTPTIPCTNGWEFLFDDIPYSTIVNEREWVCDKASLVPWSQTISFFGSVVGGILCGTLADKYGRLPVLILANVLAFTGGVATVFTHDFWDFAICRFIVGMSCDSCFIMMYILVLEYVGTKYRSIVANTSIAMYFGGGCLLLPWISLWISDWKFISVAMSVPAVFALATPFVVPESTRWLISKGKTDEAVKVLKKFERINKSNIPDDVLENFIAVANKTKEKTESVLMIFKTPSLRVMVTLLIIAFMGVALMFDNVIRLSENLGLDFFVTFTVTSATEIPSIIILVLLLDRVGRRWFVTAPMMIAGVLCLAAAFVPRGLASVALAVSARFFNNMSYGTVIQWTPELLPTPVRASGASFVHISAFAAVMISPFIIYSDRVWEGLSLIIVGVIGIVASCVALLLPETKGRRMPQTLDNWETLASTTCFAKKTGTADKTDCR